MQLQYITISADLSSSKAKRVVQDLLDYLKDNYEILSAVGTNGGVHYIIAKKEYPL